MRNIVPTLRTGRNTVMLLAAVTGLSYMASCSSEVKYDNQQVPESLTTKDSYTVYGADPSRIHNFGNYGTRSFANEITIPEKVEVPSDAQDLKTVIDNGNVPAGVYELKAGDTLDSGIVLNNTELYVSGTLNVGDSFKGTGTVYVLEGATVNFTHEWMSAEPDVTVYNYGTLKGKNLTVAGKIYSAVDIDDFVSFGIIDSAEIYSLGTITAESVQLNGSAAACGFIATKEITLNGTGTIKTSYFESPLITLNKGNVILDQYGLVKAGTIMCSNGDSRFTIEEGGTNAVVAADLFNTNNITWGKDIFAANIALDFKSYAIAGSTQYWDGTRPFQKSDFGFQVSDENQVIYVPAAGCHKAYGEKPANETTTEIVKISEISPLDPEHDHGNISATCINFGANGIAYASYHLRGEGQKGCIEVINDNGEAGLSLGSYMISPDYDFNHIIVDGNRIVTVGNHAKKGAFVGALPTDFDASESVRNDFEVKELTTDERIYGTEASTNRPGEMQAIGYRNAGDGNSIVKYGDKYYFTSYRGYGVINEDFSKVADAFTATNGSCKHIAIGNGKTAVLAHDTFDKTSSTASVYTFGLPNGTFGDVLASYDAIGTIEPVDGKNVVAIDGDDIYACLSHGGLARIRGGQVETKTFGGTSTESTKYEGVPVNGLAIDADYLYVAAGSFVYVLEKESMEEVCHYYAESQKSSNYIALNNGKIYVAYGEDGIMAFELQEKTIEE